ncbi:MAG TPA: type II secretion system protein GspM [Kiloniellales bacterium]|nr:type II secretion system protein GspM [Kiloniellales bacterium]
MIAHLPPPVRRSLALAILAGLIGVAYVGVVDPMVERYLRDGERIEENLALIERYRRLAAASESLKTRLEALERRERESQVYLAAADENLAGAELQTFVNRIAKESGAEVRSVQVLPPRRENDALRVGVLIQMTATVEGLAGFAHAAEAGPQLLFLDNLSINSRVSRRTVDTESGSDPVLTVRVELYGYLRQEEA